MATRSGELAMRPLPAVLLDLHEDLATGKLSLRRGRVAKTVDLVNGNPVSTASNPRDETLGHFLVGSGVITEDQHRLAIARAAETGGKLGEALVAMRVLGVEQLIDQLGRQARHKLVAALRWPQGAWRFDDGSEAAPGMQLRMVELVLDGLRETAVDDMDRLTRLDAMTFELTDRGKRLRHELKRAYGDRVLQVLQAGAAIGDIERAFGDRASARIAIDAMLLCDAATATVAVIGLGSKTIPIATQTAGMAVPQLPRAPTRPQLPPQDALYDMLFDDLADEREGSMPIDLVSLDDQPVEDELGAEDSGVVSTADLEAASADREHAATMKQMLTGEHQRVQGADHYAVLMVGRRATGAEIEAAFHIRTSLVDQAMPLLDNVHERRRADEVRRAYENARMILTDDRKRSSYDRELAGGELVQVPPAIDTELAFRMAEELLARKQWTQAIGHIKTVIARAPGEADYHAALGWAEWMGGGASPAAADAARPHLNQALAINPDHPAAHDFKGRIDAGLASQGGDDTEALFHLERAIELDPTRIEAAATIEQILVGKGELRRWERMLKRLLFRLRGKGNVAEAKAWARLARLYFDHFDDASAGAAAATNARKIAPKDSDVAGLIQRAERYRRNTIEPMRAGWREALGDSHRGAALVRNTEASGHADAAFLAASTMVALGTADDSMANLYELKRVRGLVEPTAPIGRELWSLLRHKDDTLELGALMELVAPAIHAVAPMTLRDGDLDPSGQLADADLPEAFAKVRERAAAWLGVPMPAVYPRVELGSQIHVVATSPGVLVAGDDALQMPERPELVFRLVRAMTFLYPGRAASASRPGRVLRAVVMAVFREASMSDIGSGDPLAHKAEAALAALTDEARVQARAAALRLLSRGGELNLSLWARSLSRTADRTGMLLCGDVAAAFAGAREVGDLDRDLVEFAYSAAHVNLRRQLGLAR